MKLFEEDPDTPAFNETLSDHPKIKSFAELKFSHDAPLPEQPPNPLKMPKQRKSTSLSIKE